MRYKLKIQIGNNEPNFGKGVVELLELCDKYGSLSKAYKEMGMSNSKAWKIIKRCNCRGTFADDSFSGIFD